MRTQSAQFSVAFIRDVFYYSAARGIPLEQLCQAAQIPQTLLDDPDAKVDGPTMSRAWDTVVKLTADPDFALHLGEASSPAVLGLLGFAMLSSERVSTALDRLRRYWNLLSDASVIEIELQPAHTRLALRLVDLPGNFMLESRHPSEASLSGILTIIQSLTGKRPPVLAVRSQYPRPASNSEYVRIFGREPEFDAGESSLLLPREVLDWRVLHANPALLESFEQQIQKRLAPLAQSTRDLVRREAAKQLRGESPELEAVARALGKSERVLQRELQTEGTSFREVVEELRKDLAIEYLEASTNSIADIAFLLGFSEPSAFHRSFRRWTGLTPQAYRRSAPATLPG